MFSPRPAWQLSAACKWSDGEGFYAETPTAQALATCQRCPVRDACLADALARDERWGLWGGMTPSQRRRLARQRSQ